MKLVSEISSKLLRSFTKNIQTIQQTIYGQFQGLMWQHIDTNLLSWILQLFLFRVGSESQIWSAKNGNC
jgi:hypothetical protein